MKLDITKQFGKIRFHNSFFVMFILLSFVSFEEGYTQKADWQPVNREVVVTFPDSIVRANISLQNSKPEVMNDRMYYWYGHNTINCNMGGYSGQLLHGSYSVFDRNNNLITQGKFEKGLKSGVWKTWDESGNLNTTAEYSHGLLHGQVNIYKRGGFLSETKNYKNGKQVFEEEKKLNKLFKIKKKNTAEKDSVKNESVNLPPENIQK